MSKKGILAVLLLISFNAISQQAAHKIVYDLSSADTANQSVVLRQMNNILNAAPDSRLEVVCHGKAAYMLVKEKSWFSDAMNQLKGRGAVSFKICANSMKKWGIKENEVLPIAEIVPVAILEISQKQKEGWSYIKADD